MDPGHKAKLVGASARHRWVIYSVASLALLLSFHRVLAQSTPQSGLYQIVSGRYIECCGIAGAVVSPLPNPDQSFIKLDVSSQGNLVSMTFLADDMRTVWSEAPCPLGTPVPFSFDQGVVFQNRIVFHVDPGPPPYQVYWNYTVSNSPGILRVEGTLGMVQTQCADVPNRFTHTNIVAVLVPAPKIRVSEVEVCWQSASNIVYQVQWRSVLSSNEWVNLGSPRTGDGSLSCATDKVAAGEPQRFYQVIAIPSQGIVPSTKRGTTNKRNAK